MGIMTNEAILLSEHLKTNPDFFLETAITNNLQGFVYKLQYQFGITPAATVDDVIQAIGQTLHADPENAGYNLAELLKVEIVNEALTDAGRQAIYSRPEAQAQIMAMPLSNIWTPGGEYGLPDGVVDGFESNTGTNGGGSFDWGALATGLLPGILNLFGLGNSSGGAAPSNPDPQAAYYQQMLQQQKEQQERTTKMITWGLAIAALATIIILVIRAARN